MAKRQNAWPDLRYNIDGTKLRLTAKKIASYVWIYRIKNGRYLPMQLLDNFFILLPNEEKMIDIGDVPKEEVFVTCY